MRNLVHLLAVCALAAIGLAFGLWLRDPNVRGLVALLVLGGVAAASLRRLYGRPARRPAPPAAPPPAAEDEPGAPAAPLWAPGSDTRVDLNSAGVEELQRLPGVGPVAARRILEERAAGGPFESVQALTRVPGFGPARVRALTDAARAEPREG